jgi:rubredoxin
MRTDGFDADSRFSPINATHGCPNCGFFVSQHEQFDFLRVQRHISLRFKAGNRWNLADASTGKKWELFFF